MEDVKAGDNIHVVKAGKVDAIADGLDTAPDALLEQAETNDQMANYSPLFAVPEGQVMISPLILSRADIDFSEPLQRDAN